VGIYAFDCNDSKGGGSSQGLFSGQINFGPKATDIDAFTESYGADQANYIIAATHNTAKVIAIHDPEFVVLDWTLAGFQKTIDASGGSKIVDTLSVTASDILSGQIVGKIQAEILRHPEANWIKSPYTFITTIGLVPALGAKAGQINVMGGEGFQPELDLLRQNKIQSVNIISSEWTGWAAADTLNSLFAQQKPADSGIGWTIADKDHNLPAAGNFTPPIDFKTEYKKAWGVS
jgi:ribose transport system substrate-binding protein